MSNKRVTKNKIPMPDLRGDYIYLIQTRESIRCNDDIYKIGRTNQELHKRMSAYPKDSKLLMTIDMGIDSVDSETDLIHIFNRTFIHREDWGNEYYQGDPDIMRDIIYKYYQDHRKVKNVATTEPSSDVFEIETNVEEQNNVESILSSNHSVDESTVVENIVNESDHQTINELTIEQLLVQEPVIEQPKIDVIKSIPTITSYSKKMIASYCPNAPRRTTEAEIRVHKTNTKDVFAIENIDINFAKKRIITCNPAELKVGDETDKFRVSLVDSQLLRLNKTFNKNIPNAFVIYLPSLEMHGRTKKYPTVLFKAVQ